MAHRAALYSVRVKRTWNEYRPLGDFDERGTHLASLLEAWLPGFERENEDGSKLVRCVTVERDADEVRAVLRHGETGVTADILDAAGGFRIRQRSDDSQEIQCCALFLLPRSQESGWLALHVPSNRGVLGLLRRELQERFDRSHDDLRLHIEPFVEAGVLKQAVDAGRIGHIRLVKWVRPDDPADAAVDKWIRRGQPGQVEVNIRPSRGAGFLSFRRVKRYLDGQNATAAYNEIVEFSGMEFDQANVEVELDDGTRRTFNIEKPDSGHAFTQDLHDLELAEDGEPTVDSVMAGLREALQAVM